LVVAVVGWGVGCSGGDPETAAATTTTTAAGAVTVEEAAGAYAECRGGAGVDLPDPEIEADGSVYFDLAASGATDEEMAAGQEVCQPIMEAVVPEGEAHEIERADPSWEEVAVSADCECADGSDYKLFSRPASTDRVVLFLDGGGACYSAETCDPDGLNEYQTQVDEPNGEGIFDFDNEANPFAGDSFVYAPYCTGDVFLGDKTAEYTDDLTIQHKGYVNGTAALDYLATTYPDATEVVVVGASAGAVSAPLYGGLVADRLPDAKVTVIADSAGSYPDVPEMNVIPQAWGWDDEVFAAGLYIAAGRDHPDITFARYDHAFDENQALHIEQAGVDAEDLVGMIDANEQQIEASGIDLHSYTAPGDDHVVFDNDSFYSEDVDGVALVDWATALVTGEPPDDVHCAACEA
jgi:hypothetical protein